MDIYNKIQDSEQLKALPTEVSEDDAAMSWTDEYGVIYSSDKKRLLKAPKEIVRYSIPIGTEIVCDWAFGGCEELEVIDLCESLIAIGNRAFHECMSIKSVVVPGNVIEVGIGAFSGCESLRSVIVTMGVKSIEAEAFQACVSLESISLPNSLIQIKEWAFAGCSSLKSITIPSSVSFIGSGAFEGCNCSIICNSTYYKSYGYDLFSPSKFIYCSTGMLGNYILEDRIDCIGEYAFFDCTMLKSIVLPDSVTIIEDGAFCGCSSMKSLQIPGSIIEIGKNVFDGCDNLNKIYVPVGSKEQIEKILPEFAGIIIEKGGNDIPYRNEGTNVDDDAEEGLSLKSKRFGRKDSI